MRVWKRKRKKTTTRDEGDESEQGQHESWKDIVRRVGRERVRTTRELERKGEKIT